MYLNSNARVALLAAAALLPLAACQSETAMAPVPAVPVLSATDTTFLNEASRSGIEEVAAGQAAQTKAGSPAIRRYAARMVSDHTTANQDLMTLAQSKQITPVSSPDDAHTAMMTKMQGERGRRFDRDYMQGQVQDHQMAVTLFDNEVQNGTDPDVKAFAVKNLPTMQAHLKMAQQLAPR